MRGEVLCQLVDMRCEELLKIYVCYAFENVAREEVDVVQVKKR